MLFFALLLKVTWILAADGGHHWTYEGEIGTAHGLALLSPQDLRTWHEDLSWGRERAFPELHPLAPLFLPTHTDPGAYTSGC
ncbi:carbonic anhydrase 14 isoform 4 precursor [Mus musculus]|uniref:Uncharacterized protein n=1 Tax=Mus musculus TaxID=10090 RepID=Q8CEY0_MOUSE|nr:carbonic anhydrase 14 isoform 4 precursor [Mus musculus]EDL38855.1 carbonic anhydrase 14, isoform CRA_b [Mus musculus]BAC25271.1 unnamed protein product [Mus musculus]